MLVGAEIPVLSLAQLKIWEINLTLRPCLAQGDLERLEGIILAQPEIPNGSFGRARLAGLILLSPENPETIEYF